MATNLPPDAAIVLSVSRDGRSALVKVPYDHRAIVQTLTWRKWDRRVKAWRILRRDLDCLVGALEAAGCVVRWRGGQA